MPSSSVDTGEYGLVAERPSSMESPPVSSWSDCDGSGSAPKSSLRVAAHRSRRAKSFDLTTAGGSKKGARGASGVVSTSCVSNVRMVPSEQTRRRNWPVHSSSISFVAHGSDDECRNAHSERALRTRSRSVQSQRALFLSLAQSQAPSAKLAMFCVRKSCNILWPRLGIPTGRAAHAAGTALRCSATL